MCTLYQLRILRILGFLGIHFEVALKALNVFILIVLVFCMLLLAKRMVINLGSTPVS
jgi:hypothetical protein